MDIGKLNHRASIYTTVRVQNSDGSYSADTDTLLGTRWCQFLSQGLGSEQVSGQGIDGFESATLIFRYDRELTSQLTAGVHFVVSTMGNARFEADGPGVERTGQYRLIHVPVTRVVDEALPSA